MSCPVDIESDEWELIASTDWTHYSRDHRDHLCQVMKSTPVDCWSDYVRTKYVMLRKWERCGGGQDEEPLRVHGEAADEPDSPTSPSYSQESPLDVVVPETPPATPRKIEPQPRLKRKIVDEDEHAAKRPHSPSELQPVSGFVFAAFSNAAASVETGLRDQNQALSNALSFRLTEVETLNAKTTTMQQEIKKHRHDIEVLVKASCVMGDLLRGKSSGEPAPCDSNGCPICLTRFANMVSRRCGHTVCSECVTILARFDNGHLCPTCREPHEGYVQLRASGYEIEKDF